MSTALSVTNGVTIQPVQGTGPNGGDAVFSRTSDGALVKIDGTVLSPVTCGEYTAADAAFAGGGATLTGQPAALNAGSTGATCALSAAKSSIGAGATSSACQFEDISQGDGTAVSGFPICNIRRRLAGSWASASAYFPVAVAAQTEVIGAVSGNTSGGFTSFQDNGVVVAAPNSYAGSIPYIHTIRCTPPQISSTTSSGTIASYSVLSMPFTMANNSGAAFKITSADLIDLTNSGFTAARGVDNYSAITLRGTSSTAGRNLGIWFNSNIASAAAGIAWGGSVDTLLYRAGAGQLITNGDMQAVHHTSTAAPTIAAGAGAGTGPTVAIAGTDQGFRVILTTGTTPAANGTIATITFGASWLVGAPATTWSPGNAATASLAAAAQPFVSAISTTAITFTANTTALAASTQYIWRFVSMR